LESEEFSMTQKERDRLVALQKAQKGLITQKQAATGLSVSERQIRRLLRLLKKRGDKAVMHASRGRPSNHRLAEEVERRAVEILRREVYRGFGPTLAAEYPAKKHKIQVGRETLRDWMVKAKPWQAKKKRVERSIPGDSGAAVATNCSSGTPANMPGWKSAERSCI
jgi:transposase